MYENVCRQKETEDVINYNSENEVCLLLTRRFLINVIC